MLKIKLLVLTILLSLLQVIHCQKKPLYEKPNLAYLSQRTGFCSEWFQYLNIDDFIIGKLTLADLKLGDTVKLQFVSENLLIDTILKGSVLPDDTSEEIINILQNNQSITFRVDLPPALPELERIFINGNELCKASAVKSTGERLVLEHTLQITNGSLKVFKNNINMPYYAEVSNCELNDTTSTNNELTTQTEIGTIVFRSEYPWLVAIYKKQGTGTAFICSGSLLTSELILTAAHCFQSLDVTAENLVAHLGRHNLANNQEENVVVRNIETIILHPEYNAMSSFSDANLALLKMQTTVNFTQYIKPICFWSETADKALIDGHSGMLVGWTTVEYENTTSAIPKKFKTYVVPQAECLRSSPIYTVTTSSRTLCVEKRVGFEPCMRTPGGHLILKRNERWMLRGIISAGLTPQKSCDSQEYTVFSDIAKHLPWLGNHIGEHLPPITGPLEDICGVAGTKSRTAYPWLATIYFKSYTSLLFLCTGTLISSRTVIAAAHCFITYAGATTQPFKLRIYLGRYDLSNIMESGVVTRDVASLLIHPKYSNDTDLSFEYDLVLLQLSAAVSFTESIIPICLWTEPAVQLQIIGAFVTLLNWDIHDEFNGNFTVPQSSEVTVVPMRHCNLEGFSGDTLSRFLCTPRFGKNGDGILMMRRNDGRYMIRGLSTANLLHFEIDERQKFRAYSDLAEYIFWIRNNILL